MQGANPIMINPVMYSGVPLRKVMDKINIRNGPIIQVIKRETKRSFRLLNIFVIFSNLTFANGGYIIKINPMAIGILVVPLEND
jgi:hypothetical protein